MAKTSVLVAGSPADDLLDRRGNGAGLEDYIIKDDLYRNVVVRTSEGDQRLQMTGGDLLTRLHRLQAGARSAFAGSTDATGCGTEECNCHDLQLAHTFSMSGSNAD